MVEDNIKKNIQNKCPKCSSTDISLKKSSQVLSCHNCNHIFKPEKFVKTDISKLKGKIISLDANNVAATSEEIQTFKCDNCSAEVVINAKESHLAKCHWCHNKLSINQQIINGTTPDMLLPFAINKKVAQNEIKKFIKQRRFFAHPKFTRNFCADNIIGVFFPYMVIDINAKVKLTGQGEKSVKTNKDNYEADLYNIEREFDLIIDALTIEASAEKIQHKFALKTNNIINSIMPFDTENAVKWDANYIKKYTSEKRNIDAAELEKIVNERAKDISRHSANTTLTDYDRGVFWQKESLNILGEEWKTAYLPVWLYSYQEIRKDKKILHYVAVNGRTGKTTGNIPLNIARLILLTTLIQILGLIVTIIGFSITNSSMGPILLLPLTFGIIFLGAYRQKYRNLCSRFAHEKYTKSKITNIRKSDFFTKNLKGLNNAKMENANNLSVSNVQLRPNKILFLLIAIVGTIVFASIAFSIYLFFVPSSYIFYNETGEYAVEFIKPKSWDFNNNTSIEKDNCNFTIHFDNMEFSPDDIITATYGTDRLTENNEIIINESNWTTLEINDMGTIRRIIYLEADPIIYFAVFTATSQSEFNICQNDFNQITNSLKIK